MIPSRVLPTQAKVPSMTGKPALTGIAQAQSVGGKAYAYGQSKKPTIGSFKKGGMVHKTGPYLLHKGEYVVNKDGVDKAHKSWMMSEGGAMKA